MSADSARFPLPSRLLHWVMAAMILIMLFIGIGMAASVSGRYEVLVSIHKPLGIAILILVDEKGLLDRRVVQHTGNENTPDSEKPVSALKRCDASAPRSARHVNRLKSV